MDKQALIDELRVMFEDYLKARGLDLIELVYRYEGRDLFLRILTDRPEGGITIQECAQLNKEISYILDEKDMLQARYILEISSPGMDRALKAKSDFCRCLNRRARFFLSEAVGGKIELEGTISKVDDAMVYVDIEGAISGIPLDKINKAKQIIC